MTDRLAPDTTLALLQASQGDAAKASKTLKQSKDLEKIEESAKDFEALFIAEMMKPMFEGISTEAPFGGGKGEEVFRGMLVQEYGKILSQTGDIGLASQVRDAMIQMQEAADQKTANVDATQNEIEGLNENDE